MYLLLNYIYRSKNNVIIIKTKVHLSRVNVAIVDVLLSCLDSLVCLCRTHVQLYIYIFIIFSSIFAYNLQDELIMFDSNFKTIQWWSVLLMEQTGLHVPGENTQFVQYQS